MIDITEVAANLAGFLAKSGASNWLRLEVSWLSDLSNLVFFHEINSFLHERIDAFGFQLLARAGRIAGGVALTLLTLWIMVQSYRVVSGQSRDSMMGLLVSSLRATFIVGAATTLAVAGSDINQLLTNDLGGAITQLVTGQDEDAYRLIDRSLGSMQLALSSIDALHVGDDPMVDDAKTRAMWFTGIGTGGPAITAGAMLLLNRIAMALFLGLGPLFILCLLFDQTKALFQKWLFYGIGTMFSLAVLSVMVALSLDMVTAVAQAFWAGKFTGASQEGVSSMALQQGGLGMILTVLIVSAPPMAANFFNGVIGQFSSSNAFQNPAGTMSNASGARYHGAYGASSQQDAAQASSSSRVTDGFANPATSSRVGSNGIGADEVKKSLPSPGRA